MPQGRRGRGFKSSSRPSYFHRYTENQSEFEAQEVPKNRTHPETAIYPGGKLEEGVITSFNRYTVFRPLRRRKEQQGDGARGSGMGEAIRGLIELGLR
jgi:hypothetical protein